MTWTEFIHIRAYSDFGADDIISAFYQLSVTQPEDGLTDISLLRNRSVVNDFSIRLTWHGELPETEKSRLGYQLVEAFSKMGWVNHTIWLRETSLFLLNGRFTDVKK
jgi:hypothetical protein